MLEQEPGTGSNRDPGPSGDASGHASGGPSTAPSRPSAAPSRLSINSDDPSAAPSGPSAAQSGLSHGSGGPSAAQSGPSATQSGLSTAQSGSNTARSGVGEDSVGPGAASVPAARPAGAAGRAGVAHTDPTRRAKIWWTFQHLFCYPVMKLVYRAEFSGTEHVPASGGALLVSTHQSFMDPILVAMALKRPVAFLARHDLFRNKLFSWWIRSLHAFPIHQGKGQAGPIRESVRLLDKGWMLNIFPEGERTPDGTILPAQGGVALVVRRAKVPVVPCVIDGAFEIWPRHKAAPRPWGKIRVRYGPAMELHDLSADDIRARIDEAFAKLHDEIRKGVA